MGADERAANDSSSPKRRIDPWRLLWIFTGLAIAGTLISFLGSLSWFFENFGAFRVHYGLALLLAGIAFLCRKRWKGGAVCCGLAAVNGFFFLPLYFGGDTVPEGAKGFRVIALNVHTGNKSYARVRDYLRASEADVVILQEVNRRWIVEISELENLYPFRKAYARPDNFGIAIFSRTKPSFFEFAHFGSAGVPSIVTEFEVDGNPLTIIGTHPVPPSTGEYARFRNEQLAEIAESARALKGAALVIGDLNTTSDSPVFKKFVRRSGLRDSRQGFGVLPSWPVQVPFMLTAIDHALVSGQILVKDRRTGPNVGSDHYAVEIDVVIRE